MEVDDDDDDGMPEAVKDTETGYLDDGDVENKAATSYGCTSTKESEDPKIVRPWIVHNILIIILGTGLGFCSINSNGC
jgi:hypothetical protein